VDTKNRVLLLVGLFVLLNLRALKYGEGGLEGNTAANGREMAQAFSCPTFVQASSCGVSMDVPPIFLSDVTTSKLAGLLSMRCPVQISAGTQTAKCESFT
jgi:hypothetical protein